ncbi:MAG: hypothetical protein ACFFBD_20670 [Candidatus Hodarchaeota archaeon]
MVLNWTTAVGFAFLGVVLNVFTFSLVFRQFLRTKYRHFLLISLDYLFLIIICFFETLGHLFAGDEYFELGKSLYVLSLYLGYIPTAFFTVLLSDSISRDSVDPIKLSITAILATGFVFTSMDPNGVAIIETNGEKFLFFTGSFGIFASSLVGLTMILWLYYNANIYRNAPKNLKSYAKISFFGALLFFFGTLFAIIFRLNYIIPGIHRLPFDIGLLIIAIVFAKQPKLAFILPFKASKITVFNDNGIPLFTHIWSTPDELVEDALFTGMLTGIGAVLSESLGKGNLREIQLDQARLLLQRSEQFRVTCGLVATQSSQILRQSLNTFANRFFQDFSGNLADLEIINPEDFASASELVVECFPFVPEYYD